MMKDLVDTSIYKYNPDAELLKSEKFLCNFCHSPALVFSCTILSSHRYYIQVTNFTIG